MVTLVHNSEVVFPGTFLVVVLLVWFAIALMVLMMPVDILDWHRGDLMLRSCVLQVEILAVEILVVVVVGALPVLLDRHPFCLCRVSPIKLR